MASAKEILQELLQATGHSFTTARFAVFDALKKRGPLSMHDLVSQVSAIDRASVYRTVKLFEELEVVQRLYNGWKYKIELTDKFAAHHHHLTCTICEKTVAMNESQLEVFIERLTQAHGFKPTNHQIELQGICSDCQQKN